MAQKKDGKSKVAKATKKVAKKLAVKKSVKRTAAMAPSNDEPNIAAPTVPSFLLRLADAEPKDFSYFGFANEAWGIVWSGSASSQNRRMFRQPLFTLTGAFGDRLNELRRNVGGGRSSLNDSLEFDRDPWVEFARKPDDFKALEDLCHDSNARADLRWIQLWVLNDLDCLDSFAAPDDTFEGDRDFVAWVELLLMVEEISDLFRGTNSDIWRGMENSSWLQPQGPGLLLLRFLGQAGAGGFPAKRNNRASNFGAFPQIYTNNDFMADEAVLVALREACCAIFGKVVEVLQSPAMESRFRSFFGGLASELNITPEELWNSMYGMSRSSYGDDTYMPLLVAKLGQVFGLLKDYDETPLTLTDALEKWVGWIRGEPKGGWPVGKKYEAKANAERLKLIADAQRKGRVEAPEPAKKRIF